MKIPNDLIGDFENISALAVFWICWFCFMIAKPELWSRIVDKENDFWLKKGIISASSSEKYRQFEKGKGLKILVGCGALVTVGGFLFLLWACNQLKKAN